MIIRWSAVCLVTPTHPTLAAPSATSAGDPTKDPPISSRPTVVHQEAPVLGESTQEAPKVPVSQAWETPAM
jgi:hypothetical protein